MHLPKIKFKKNVTFKKDIFLRIAKSIKTNQLDSGAIPSNADLSHDPWDHIEAIMGLNFLKDKESSDLAFKWLKNNQNKDGSWYAKYSNNDPIELNKPTHFGPYISVAALHYYKIFSDKDKLFELWETIQSAIDFSIDLQNSNGTIPWSVDKNNQIENDFLLTGSSSILKSLECAIAISKILDLDSNEKWTKAYESLAYAIRNPEGLFDKTTDRSRFSMDSYYPIISVVLLDYEQEKFVDYYLSNGATRADWNASFRMWIRRCVEYKQSNESKGHTATSTGEIQNRRSRISGVAQSRNSGTSSSKVKRLRDRQGD